MSQEQTVSNLIQNQFPAFYNEDGPLFIAFVQAYYEWLEQSYGVINLTLYDSTKNFSNGEIVYQALNSTNVATGTLIGVSGSTLTINNFTGTFTSNLSLNGATSLAVANVAAVSDIITLGNPTYQTRNLLSYIDIDNTLNEFIVYFTNTYLQGIQYDILADPKLAVKRILDLYRAKGTSRAIKLLFQLVFAEDIDLYIPGNDILKPSDGIWTIPQYLEVSNSPILSSYVGQTVTGVTSGATAYVDRIITRPSGSKLVNLFYLTNASEKSFITGEVLSVNNNITNAPIVVGSLSNLIITNGGSGFNVGDIVNLLSSYGIEGTARVTSTAKVNGTVSFTFNDGGWGYSNSTTILPPQLLISNTVLYLSNVQSTLPTSQNAISKFANIVIYNSTNSSVANVYANAFAYSSNVTVFANGLSGKFSIGETLLSQDGNASGVLTAFSQSGSNVTLSVSNVYNSYFSSSNLIIGQTSGAFALVSSFNTNIGIIGLSAPLTNTNPIIGYNTIGVIYPGTITLATGNTWYTGEVVYQTNGTANIATGIIIGKDSTSTALIVQPLSGTFTTTTGSNSALTSYLTRFSNIAGSVTTGFIPGEPVYQTNGTANILYGKITNKFTTNFFASIFYGSPNISYPIIGSISGAKMSFTATNIANSATSILSYTPAQNVSANLIGFSSGNGASILLGTIGNNTTDTITAYTDIIGGNNVGNESYLSITLSGNPGTAYGFPAKPTANLANGTLASIFTTQTINLGEIPNITITNPGNNYNYSPFIEIYQPGVADLQYQDYYFTIDNINGTFSNGEIVTQNVNSSNAIGRINSLTSTTMSVKRMSISSGFQVSGSNTAMRLIGSTSSASANITLITANTLANYSGDNANISANVISSNGVVTSLSVIDSGIGYINNSSLIFQSQTNSLASGNAIAILGKQGYGTGYYDTTKGFLSADKYIQDGYFYQNFSYEIKSSQSVDKYYDMVKQVVHTAGTALYGAVVKKEYISTPLNITSTIQIVQSS